MLLCSETGAEISGDPPKLHLPATEDAEAPSASAVRELDYSDADWAAAVRRRNILCEVADRPTTSAEVAVVAEALPRRPDGSRDCCDRCGYAATT